MAHNTTDEQYDQLQAAGVIRQDVGGIVDEAIYWEQMKALLLGGAERNA